MNDQPATLALYHYGLLALPAALALAIPVTLRIISNRDNNRITARISATLSEMFPERATKPLN
jgi:hypothetical protein